MIGTYIVSIRNTLSVYSVISDYVQGPVWDGYPESLDEKVFIYSSFMLSLILYLIRK